jgi:hypothetical protein
MPGVVGPKVDAVTAPDEVSEVFAPVVVSSRSEGAEMSAGGVMEIELSGGRRLRVDRDVDAEALRRVLAVLGQLCNDNCDVRSATIRLAGRLAGFW